MKAHTQCERTWKIGLWQLAKYVLLSIIIISGFAPITASGGDSDSPRSGTTLLALQQPEPELLIDDLLMPTVEAITSDEAYLYVGSQHEIDRINKATLEREALTGNLIDVGSALELGIVEHPGGFVIDGNYLYFYDWGYHIKRVFIGADGKSAIQTVVPQAGLGTFMGFTDLACNDTHLFWINTLDGIYSKDIGSRTLPTPILSAGGAGHLYATSTTLFITTEYAPSPAIYKYDIPEDKLELVQSNVTPNKFWEIPTALSVSEVFWVNGDTIYRMPHSSTIPQVLVDSLPNTTRITADDSTLYALEGGLTETNTIYEVNLASGDITPLVTADDIRNILVYDGALYWISAYGLYTRNADGTIIELYINDGSEIIFGGAWNTEMVGTACKVAIWAGSDWKILFHDIAAESSDILNMIHHSLEISANTDSVYFGSINGGISRIPAELNLRFPETLRDKLVWVEKLFLHNGWLYWSEYSNRLKIYRISRMQVDGSQYEILFDKIHRGLAVYNDRLYFMCESGCSLPSWTLVSMPLDGGTPVPEFPLGEGPVQMIQKDGIFYVADKPPGGSSMSIYAISLEFNASCELLSGLRYSDIELQVSPSGWLYRLQGWLVKNSLSGCSVGQDQPIDPDVITMHSDDGNAVYYWRWLNGLKVLYESPVEPSTDIKANGSDGPLTIQQGEKLTVTIALGPGSHNGENADWWVAAITLFGSYWYTLDRGWVRSDPPIRVYSGPLFYLSPYEVLNISGLPTGTYTFYFGVDMLMNGSLDFGKLYFDSVDVTIK